MQREPPPTRLGRPRPGSAVRDAHQHLDSAKARSPTKAKAYLQRALRKQLRKLRVQACAQLAVLREAQIAKHEERLLVGDELLRGDRARLHAREGAPRREEVVPEHLRLGRARGVVDRRDWLVRDLPDLRMQRVWGEVAVEDVRRPDCLQEVCVAERCGRDDGAESRELEQLDGCTLVSDDRNVLPLAILTDLTDAAGATEDNCRLTGILTAATFLPGRGEAARTTDGILARVVERYSGRCESEGDRSRLVEANVRRYLSAQVRFMCVVVR